MIDIKKLYDNRFTTLERVRKRKLWHILCRHFLQQYIKIDDVILDVGAGQCEFINNIKGGKKIALDINKNISQYADSDVIIKTSSVKHLKNLFPKDSIDVIFMSNLLEHLDNKEEIFRLLNEAFHVLKKHGRLLIMQPDISLVGNSYWDFFDHKVPLTYPSLVEALLANNFNIKDAKYPFLPYSTKAKYLPLWPPFLSLYLKFRPLQILFGKQFFVCAQK